MAEPFLGEIRLMSFDFPPKGWAACNGQLLPINQNQALFALLRTMYGGNGQTTFALPDLRRRVPMHVGNGHTQGERAGEETHTLTVGELPAHVHVAQATAAVATTSVPTGAVLAAANNAYGPAAGGLTAMAAGSATTAGSSQPHGNMAPFLVIGFCIALQGIFPSGN